MMSIRGFRIMCRGMCQLSTRSSELIQQREARLLKVAIIGMPNAGKSTLINQLLELEVCPVSKRVHTTRQPQKAVYLRDNTQVIFVDTPGVVNRKETKKFKFEEEFVKGPYKAIEDADIVGVIHDVSNRILRHKLDPRVVSVLKKHHEKTSILILNKVDTIKFKRSLLDAVRFLTKSTVGGVPIPMKPSRQPHLLKADDIIARAKARENNERTTMPKSSYTDVEDDNNDSEYEVNGWAGFNDVFMISALTGDGINLLEEYFVTNAKSASWEFKEEVLTDIPPMELSLKILKSKMLEYMPDEIPYAVTPTLDLWEEQEETGTLRIVFGIKCPKERYARIVIGQGGHCINQVQLAVEKSLSGILQKVIDLHIKVLVEEKKKS